MKKYKFGFDASGFILFLTIMIPNIIWMMKPAPNDILRTDSLTPVLDIFMSIFQIIFVGTMCGVIKKENRRIHFSTWIIIAVISVAVYFITWGILLQWKQQYPRFDPFNRTALHGVYRLPDRQEELYSTDSRNSLFSMPYVTYNSEFSYRMTRTTPGTRLGCLVFSCCQSLLSGIRSPPRAEAAE